VEHKVETDTVKTLE